MHCEGCHVCCQDRRCSLESAINRATAGSHLFVHQVKTSKRRALIKRLRHVPRSEIDWTQGVCWIPEAADACVCRAVTSQTLRWRFRPQFVGAAGDFRCSSGHGCSSVLRSIERFPLISHASATLSTSGSVCRRLQMRKERHVVNVCVN